MPRPIRIRSSLWAILFKLTGPALANLVDVQTTLFSLPAGGILNQMETYETRLVVRMLATADAWSLHRFLCAAAGEIEKKLPLLRNRHRLAVLWLWLDRLTSAMEETREASAAMTTDTLSVDPEEIEAVARRVDPAFFERVAWELEAASSVTDSPWMLEVSARLRGRHQFALEEPPKEHAKLLMSLLQTILRRKAAARSSRPA